MVAAFSLIATVLMAGTAVTLASLVHAAKQPRDAWEAARQNQVVWLVALAVALVSGAGFVVGFAYWFLVRPRLNSAAPSPRPT